MARPRKSPLKSRDEAQTLGAKFDALVEKGEKPTEAIQIIVRTFQISERTAYYRLSRYRKLKQRPPVRAQLPGQEAAIHNYYQREFNHYQREFNRLKPVFEETARFWNSTEGRLLRR